MAVLVLAGCARAIGSGGGGPQAGPTTTPSPPAGEGIVFLLEPRYPMDHKVQVRIMNVGDRPYRYNSSGYEACELTYRDKAGDEFIIPPGTHCDLIAMADIVPGETVTLFTWHLDQCLVDDWGCLESESLPPGTYTIEGTFEASGGGPPAHAEATFEIYEVHSIPDVADDETTGSPEPTDG